MRVWHLGQRRRARLSRRWLITAALLTLLPSMAGLIVSQRVARADVSLSVAPNSSIWEENTASTHVLHVFGEVSNAGPDSARQLQVTCTLYNAANAIVGQATDPAEADILLPTESSPFDALIFTWTAYDHYGCTVAGAATTSQADHNFTTTITGITTDGFNRQHITGTVVNNQSVSVEGVNTMLTLYNSAGTVMDELVLSINNANPVGPGQANSVTFDAIRTANRPTWGNVRGDIVTLTEAPAPAVNSSTTPHNFGEQPIGTTSATQTLTVTNRGTADLVIAAHGVTLTGTNLGDFHIVTDTCSGQTIAADGGTCTIGLTFQPTDYGARSATLQIADNADQTPQTAALTGTGVSRSAIGASPSPLDFGIQAAGTETTKTLTISSTGLDAATITSIVLDDTTAFSIPSNTCLGSLAAGTTCSLAVTFAPPAGTDQTYSTNLTITATDANGHAARNSPDVVGLTGHGANGGATVTPDQLAFGAEPVGSTTASKTVTLMSNGQGPLLISSIQASGDFAQTNDCPSSLASGQSCTISVTFTPSSVGARTGSLTVNDNDPTGPASVALTGTGTPALTAFYFAEGFTGSGFHEVLSMLTPSDPATATIDYFTNVGHVGPYTVPLTAGEVKTEDVNARIAAATLSTAFNGEVSARVTLSARGIVERTINFNNGTWHGSTDQVGTPHASAEWDFAEGSTNRAYSEFLTLQNPNSGPVSVTLKYFTNNPAVHPTKQLSIAANSRVTVLVYSGQPVNDAACLPGAAGNCGVGPGIDGVSVQVLSTGGPIVAERPFYVNGFNFGSGIIRDGHDAFGAYAPGTDWYFAEGTTFSHFNEYLTLENPNSAQTLAHLTYIDNRSHPTLKTVVIPQNSRVTVLVFGAAQGVGPGIEGVSVHVHGDLPIVAERPMYMVENFGSGVVAGAHDAVGATGLATRFGFAASSTLAGDTDFLTIQNPGDAVATVDIFYYAGGAPIHKTKTVAGNTRLTVRVGDDVPAGKAAVGIVIFSNQPILVEKPTYSSNAGTYGATDAVGYTPPAT